MYRSPLSNATYNLFAVKRFKGDVSLSLELLKKRLLISERPKRRRRKR
jgi:hypothetical protein